MGEVGEVRYWFVGGRGGGDEHCGGHGTLLRWPVHRSQCGGRRAGRCQVLCAPGGASVLRIGVEGAVQIVVVMLWTLSHRLGHWRPVGRQCSIGVVSRFGC
jgi:hypothetical protein